MKLNMILSVIVFYKDLIRVIEIWSFVLTEKLKLFCKNYLRFLKIIIKFAKRMQAEKL